MRIFSPEEFRRLFGVTLRATQEFIKDHQGDLFIKIRNGLYALRSDPPHELEIANRLYGPSYISLEYALAYYRLEFCKFLSEMFLTRLLQNGGRP